MTGSEILFGPILEQSVPSFQRTVRYLHEMGTRLIYNTHAIFTWFVSVIICWIYYKYENCYNNYILTTLTIFAVAYLIRAFSCKKSEEKSFNNAEEDLLYRSRLFNRTQLQIRQLAHDNTMGLTIGICGPWGSGKTFFINKLLRNLSQRSQKSDKCGLIWEDSFVICDKVELWSASSIDDAWERVICALHKGIFGKKPIDIRWFRKLLTYLISLITPAQGASYELIRLVLPDFHNEQLHHLKKRMHERKIVIVFDDLERANFSIIQTMLPLFERLKKLPNLIVICAVAENELQQVFHSNQTNADFVQGHLHKLFDLKIDIPEMTYTAIQNYQSNLLYGKYKDCHLVKSFLNIYPLRFGTARQMVRVIDKLTSIERQYFTGCPYSFTETNDRESSVLSDIKYIFLIEALRVTNSHILKTLREQVHINVFLGNIPSDIVLESTYSITCEVETASISTMLCGDSQEIEKTLNAEKSWIQEHPYLYKIIANGGIEFSILTHMKSDLDSSAYSNPIFKNESSYLKAIAGNYTRCTILNEWEMEELLSSSDYCNMSYSQMVNQYFSSIGELQEEQFKSEAAFRLLEYHIEKLVSSKSDLAALESALSAECTECSRSFLRNCNLLTSGSYIEYIEKTAYQHHDNGIVTLNINQAIFEKMFNLLHIGEQAIVISSYFNLMRKDFKVVHTSYFTTYIAPCQEYLVLMLSLCKNYGYNLAEQIATYPSHSCDSHYTFVAQAYKDAPGDMFTCKFKEGISTYICEISDKKRFIVKWLEFMGHQYHGASIRGGCDSSFANNKVLEMMSYIRELLDISPETIACHPYKSEIKVACANSLEKLRNDYHNWSTDKNIDRKTKYSSGIFFIIQMIEEIQKAAS